MITFTKQLGLLCPNHESAVDIIVDEEGYLCCPICRSEAEAREQQTHDDAVDSMDDRYGDSHEDLPWPERSGK